VKTFWGVRLMKLTRDLGLGVAAIAWLSLTPDAFATGSPQPFTTQTYSAPTVALSAGPGTTAALPPANPTYSTIFPTVVRQGDQIVWTAPTGNTWILSGAPACTGVAPAGVVAVVAGSLNQLQCTVGNVGAGVNFVSVFNAAGTSPVALQGPAVAQLANVTNSTNPTPLVPILAQQTVAAVPNATDVVDPAPIANVSLTSSALYFLSANGQTLNIDLTGNGLPAIPPGAGFNVTPASVQPVTTTQPPAPGVPTQAVSTAGFLGTLGLSVNTNLDARNGLFIGTSDPLFTNGSLTGAVTTTLSGDFATLTSAYLLANNNVPAGNQASCTATPPAGAIIGTIAGTKNSISFTGLGNPGNPAFNGNVIFSVCLVTNGTQVIQLNNGGPGGSFGIGIIGSVQVGGITAPIPLTSPNQNFGNISYAGSTFFAQNVFGAANLYPVFFRAVNQGNTPAQIWAVLTKDVSNVVPETGAGSCNTSAAILGASPQPAPTGPGGTACNISFVANLTATTDPTGLSKGLLQPNTGAYYLADTIAAQAGTTLPAGNNKATVWLLSPNAGLMFSALSQLTTPGAPPIITSLP
jgi:hypothetical protein